MGIHAFEKKMKEEFLSVRYIRLMPLQFRLSSVTLVHSILKVTVTVQYPVCVGF